MFAQHTNTGWSESDLRPSILASFRAVFGGDQRGVIVLGAGLEAILPVAGAVDKAQQGKKIRPELFRMQRLSPCGGLHDVRVGQSASHEAAEMFARTAGKAERVARLFDASGNASLDAVQEAGIRYLSRIARNGTPASPEAYYLSCVVNEAKRHSARFNRERDLSASLSVFAITQIADHTARDAQAKELWDEIAKLPDRQRIALGMRYFLGLDTTTIADLLGCRVSTIRSTLARAIVSLREVIER